MELQEAVRLTEMLRASRSVETLDKKSKQSIWKFFSSLFSSSDRPSREPAGPLLQYNSGNPYTSFEHPESRLAITRSSNPPNSIVLEKGSMNYDDTINERSMIRREQYRQVRAHVQKEDGRLQAYGWSLPGIKKEISLQGKHAGGVPVIYLKKKFLILSYNFSCTLCYRFQCIVVLWLKLVHL